MKAITTTIEINDAQGTPFRLTVEENPERIGAYTLFARCFVCEQDFRADRVISAALAARGIATVRFEIPSEGQGSPRESAAFILRAVEHLRGLGKAPSILIGHDLGGRAMLSVASEVPESVGVATINAPFHVEGEEDGILRDKIAHMGKALLIMHAPMDQKVDAGQAAALFMAARHPRSFVSLDSADHLLSSDRDAVYAAETLAAWASRYLDVPPTPYRTPRKSPHLEHGEVIVQEDGRGKFSQDVFMGKHTLLADEPESVGGDDRGPAPYDLLLAGLGACTSMTLRMYADRKGIALDGVTVWMKHTKVSGRELPEASSKGVVDLIEREIEIRGDIEPKVRARMLDIADRCPVHRTLHNEVVIRSALKE